MNAAKKFPETIDILDRTNGGCPAVNCFFATQVLNSTRLIWAKCPRAARFGMAIGLKRQAMSDNEHRQIERESLFVLAELRIDGQEGEQRIHVRNLSSGGLMAEGSCKVQRGQQVWINLRNLAWCEGTVAWVQENRFGVAFRDAIDPRIARAPLASATDPEVATPR